MDAPPRRPVVKPLSPGLQLSDLRTISTGPAPIYPSLDHEGFSEAPSGSSEVASSQPDPSSPEGLFQARHITVVQDGVNSNNEWPPSNPSSPSGSSSSSRCGFYSFIEDPTSLEAEFNRAWMVSPQRHAHLATLKVERGFKVQTYASSRKPQSLFSENDGEQQYQVDLNDGVGAEEEEEDEERLRKEIIRHQAPRGAPRLMEGSGLTSWTQQPRPAAQAPDPDPDHDPPSTINKDSINFTAARQQFLRLEQDRASGPLKPVSFSKTHTKASPRPEENRHQNLGQTKDVQQSSGADVLDSALLGLSSSSSSSSSSVEASWSSSSKRPSTAGSAGEKRSSREAAEQETPIEREIRVIQQREENLRRSRGLKISTAELVEIKTQRFQAPRSPSKAQDLQQHIQKTQREDHLQLKADEQEEHRLGPGDSERKADQKERREGDATELPSACCPHRHAEEPEICNRRSDTPPLAEVQDTRRLRPDWTASAADVSSASMRSVVTPRSWREKLQLSGLQSTRPGAPDFIEKDIEEALKREEELRELRAPREPSPLQAFSAATAAPDRRLQPTTPAGSVRNITSSPPHGPVKRLSSISLISAQPWTSSPSSLSPSSRLAEVRAAPPAARSLTDTLLQERRAQQKLEESSYAGILRLDHINQELVESTRVTRHKNQRALLWEAGVFTNQADQ